MTAVRLIFIPSFECGAKVIYLTGMLFAALLLLGCESNHSQQASTEITAKSVLLSGDKPALKLQRVFNGVQMESPVFMVQAPHNNNTWYVVEKPGRILRIKSDNDKYKRDVFLDITDRVDNSKNEGGFLSIAFHPDYENQHEVFLSYTREGSPLLSYISRIKRAKNADTLDPSTEQAVLTVAQPYSNHNGGLIAFGKDNYLYIGLGDGGAGGDPQAHGQNKNTLLGAMLRIDPLNKSPYKVPADNPFANGGGAAEIYAWGLRNPWRWSFDRKTQNLWLADVGQNDWEEINIVGKGKNYGWNRKEGTHCYTARQCDDPQFEEPVAEYSHDHGCSVTGGYVYRGTKMPQWKGYYFFADFCSGIIWALNADDSNRPVAEIVMRSGLNVASFAESNDGELYVIHLGGEIYHLTAQ